MAGEVNFKLPGLYNTNTSVTNVIGTTNEVNVSIVNKTATLSTPQAINTTANVQFNAIGAGSSPAENVQGMIESQSAGGIVSYFNSNDAYSCLFIGTNNSYPMQLWTDSIKAVTIDTSQNVQLVGSITAGTWAGTVVSTTYGGTGNSKGFVSNNQYAYSFAGAV
jgi:hypothetical protein